MGNKTRRYSFSRRIGERNGGDRILPPNLSNCWNILRGQLTTAYLETRSANVIRITDIGQSAAEPLNEECIYIFSQEEGSETMYQAPKSISQGEDIVQTQTE